MFRAEERFVPFEKKIWLSSPTMHGPELEHIKDAYEKNWMSTVGENINEVEHLACETVGCKYAVALATGTSALHLAVKLAGVKPGEKVFCSDMTFSATVNPVVYEGGVPVFIDTEYDTCSRPFQNMHICFVDKRFVFEDPGIMNQKAVTAGIGANHPICSFRPDSSIQIPIRNIGSKAGCE